MTFKVWAIICYMCTGSLLAMWWLSPKIHPVQVECSDPELRKKFKKYFTMFIVISFIVAWPIMSHTLVASRLKQLRKKFQR